MTKFQKGDRVWGSNQGLLGRQGTFAEYAAVDECWLYATPEEVSDQDAAAVALVGITAHLGLFREAQVRAGENVFINGGTGGVGSCVIQMARAVGARVFATAGSREKVRICRQLGAKVAVNYKTDDVDAALGKFGAIDVWFETLREQNFDLAIKHLAFRGRIVVMAGRDSRPPFPVGPVLRQRRQAVRLRHVQCPGRRAAEVRRGDQPLAGEGKASAADRPRDAAVGNGRRASPARGKYDRKTGALAGKIVLTP